MSEFDGLGSMPIVIIDYGFVISPVELVEIQLVSYKYRIKVEGYIERHAGFQYSPKTYSREDGHILRSVLKYHPITSRNIIQEFSMIALYPVST